MIGIPAAAKEISASLHKEMKERRITRADIEIVRAAVAGYIACEAMGFSRRVGARSKIWSA